jgi:hypothetical protein
MSVQMLYNTYLSQLSVADRLALIRLLVDQTITAEELAIQNTKLYDVMDFAGIGQPNAMEGDAQVYINNLRSEWE